MLISWATLVGLLLNCRIIKRVFYTWEVTTRGPGSPSLTSRVRLETWVQNAYGQGRPKTEKRTFIVDKKLILPQEGTTRKQYFFWFPSFLSHYSFCFICFPLKYLFLIFSLDNPHFYFSLQTLSWGNIINTLFKSTTSLLDDFQIYL